MRILITLSQFVLGGTETYSVTVAEQLERLGHPTLIHAPTATEPGRELVESRGVRLAVGDLSAALDEFGEVDAVLAQDSAGAYELAGRGGGVRPVFVVHGLAGFEHPPAALRPAPQVVVLNDRIGRRVDALASSPEAVRLRQPIDIARYRPRGASRRRARRVLRLQQLRRDRQAAAPRRGLPGSRPRIDPTGGSEWIEGRYAAGDCRCGHRRRLRPLRTRGDGDGSCRLRMGPRWRRRLGDP